MTNLVALPKGTELVGDYRVERVLGAGGFGITYLAEEKPLARLVTIKEYFPLDFAARDQAEDVVPRSEGSGPDYKWGLERFLEEAQTLARFNHPNIVRVYRYFRARKTGYIVLHFEEGQSFKGWLKSLGRAPRQQELDRIVMPLLDALEVIHTADYLHRDIAPDNIIVRTDGTPVLIDFGSARGDIAKHTKTLSALVKPGYSPYEQYATTSNAQGPWTDIYSLAATLYHAMTGKRPPDAPSRMVQDDMMPVRDAALSSYRPAFLAAVDRALALEVGDRPKSIAAWRTQLSEPIARPQRQSAAAARQSAGPSDSAPPEPTPEAGVVALEPPSPPEPPPSMRPQPLPGAVKPKRQKRAKVPGSRSVVGAFLDGWRKAGSASASAAAGAASQQVRNAPPPPAVGTAEIAAAASRSFTAPPAPQSAAQSSTSQTAHDAGSRKATPRAIRQRSNWRWAPILMKCTAGAGIAAAIVALQDRMPTVRSEGSTTVLSQAGDTVPLGQLKGHRGAVNALVYVPDGRYIVSTAADATIKIWNAANRALVRTIELDNGAATSLAVHERRAVTGHRDGTIVLWDIETAAKIASFRRNDSAVLSVAFLDEPHRVVASSQDAALSIWDATSPAQPAHVLSGNDSAAQAVAYSARSGHIASGSVDKTVKLWKVDGASPVRTYRGHTDYVSALAFSPDGRRLASSSLDGQIRVWSTMSNRLHYTLRGHQGRIGALAFSPDGEHIASASDDGSVRLWSVKQARSLRTLHPHTGEIRAVGFAPDGRRIAAAGIDGLVRLYNATVTKPGT